MSGLLPLNNPTLIGHDEAQRQVTEAFASGRMHHAWLITGIEGIGKMTLAYHIAQHALSGGENKIGKLDMNHRAAKLVSAEAHPDMLTVCRVVDDKTGELRASISVDEALTVAPFLHKTSTHGGWRVVLIDEAHLMTRNAQNAILKILEEPPSQVLIVITVTTPGALLPTIRSRCRLLPLSSLEAPQMRAILSRAKPDLLSDDMESLIAVSNGSPGFALKIIRTEALPLYAELRALLSAMPKLDIARVHKLADQISRKADAEGFEVLRSLLTEHIRKETLAMATSGATSRLGAQLQLWEKVRSIFAMTDGANLDRKLAFINIMNEMRAAA